MSVKVETKPSTQQSRAGRSNIQVWVQKLIAQRYLQVMALLGVAWMIVFNYIPMYGIIIAFKEFDIIRPISAAPWVGFDHFKEFFEDDSLGYVIKNTIGMSLIKLVIGFPLPILFALLLNELRSMVFKRWVQTITYLPHFLSWVVLGGIMATWLSDVGIVNKILMAINVIHEPITYLAEPKYFWGIVITSDIWKELGWSAIIYLAAISSISPELYEAATIDGAGRGQKMWNITLPSIKGTISILFILAISGVLNSNFDQILVLRNQLNETSSNVIDVYVYQAGLLSGRYSYAAAVGLIKSVIALILLLGANGITKRLNNTSLF
ncbi:putative aldouronate transport system permease protein [Paenibacillus cellulosilyticus]|uniref:Putative aldouronate transport system permease protein n=1 Tax=Paenibacillus cellulosilyticus TaxID=375489 RepID=A0A2V2YLX7_9BACL|nr:ABC transporter permease subunit [Paenibacillus cellulosilyticus]PWV94226.1 putative aldouronate transport system permease protein [Paenibacillus cellulosilyticus]QKS44280.1 sugar ABC transporter permease [Paenibacillus cellulosilyticus]